MKNFLEVGGGINTWYITPKFSKNGEVMDIPEAYYSIEDRCYQLDNFIDIDMRTANWLTVFLPLLSSFYHVNSHFTGSNYGFEEVLEEFWESFMGNFEDYRTEFKEWDKEEYLDEYGEECYEFMSWVGDTEVGVCYNTSIVRGYLDVDMYFGDGSVGGIHTDNTSDSEGVFTAEDIEGLDVGDLCQLDCGEVPDCITETSDLSIPVLRYSLGRYLVSECLEGDEVYAENITETLYNKLVSGVDSEDLWWCELEGEEVVNKWLELLK